MKVREKVDGRAIEGENDLERKKIIRIDKDPKTKGITRRSLSGLGKGWNRCVRTKKRGG
jgi:hypothetical protein